MKPDTRTAMSLLIGQIRQGIPLDLPQAQVCTGTCEGCSLKLLEYLATELQGWECRLARGERPRLGDLSQLGRTARKIQSVLQRNGAIPYAPAGRDLGPSGEGHVK
jgi:hypothetical protein